VSLVGGAKRLWLLSCLLFVAGVSLPMFTVRTLLVFDDTFSLLGGAWHLLREGELFLFVVVFGFSILAPVYKLYLCHRVLHSETLDKAAKGRLVKRLAMAGKWSMADVFVVAVTAATVKFGMVASVEIHVGLYVFAAAVISSMLLLHHLLSGYELRPVGE